MRSPDQEPRRVVLARLHPSRQSGHCLASRPLVGCDQGQLSPRSLARIAPARRGPVGETGDDPVLVDRQPGSPGHPVLPAEDPGVALPQDAESIRRPIEPLVAVGRHHQRVTRLGLPSENEKTHHGQGISDRKGGGPGE